MSYKKKNEFDIIIIGAGLSGLTLAKEISEKTKKKILIIEKERSLKQEKNWCFWNTPRNYFTDLHDTSWEKILIKIHNEELILKNGEIKYLHINSLNFFKHILKDLKKKNVNFLFNNNIKEVYQNNHKNFVKTKKGVFKSKILFDSRPTLFNSNEKNLLQHFIGFEVVFKDNILDKTKITLMDFQNFTNGINFMYILPFSENRALFEPTYFSTKIFKTSIYKKCLVNYLKKNFPGKSYKIKFKEKGILPMFYTKNINHNRNYFQIGISGNWLRASTGYSFQNSFIYAEEITKQLINEKKIKFKNKFIINFLDEIFCNLIKKNPKKFEYIFKCFFFKNSLESIVNFLNGKSNFLQTVIIILSLPKKDLFLSMLGIIKNKFATK